MRMPAYGALFLRLAGVVLLFVLINAATYIFLLQRLAGGRATYYPFVINTAGAIVLAVLFAWRGANANGNLRSRTFLCLSSAVIVGSAVILLSLFVIVNTLGA